ncbi:MAG: type III-B CRISPR module RAMP protein Cmr1 [Thermoplasmataceae archaeon]
MISFEAKFKITLPMFMFGAINTKPEIRAPSFKGILRFWWRALALGRFKEISKIREEESKIFGSSRRPICQSNIIISLNDKSINSDKKLQLRKSDSRSYIAYGLTEKCKEYLEGTFIINGTIKQEKTMDVDLLFDAFKAIGLIGGMGGRARRGWGSLTLLTLDTDVRLWTAPKTIPEYKKEIDRLKEYGKNFTDEPEYTSFSSTTRIKIGREYSSANDAHTFLAELYKIHIKNNDYDRKYFGLPRGSNSHRRASPLFFHVHELNERSFIPVVSFFPSVFCMNIKNEPNWDKSIIEFIDKIKENGD